jgi:hypothetical protein
MKYYTIINPDRLNEVMPQVIKQYMGYDKDYTLAQCVHGNVRYLPDGRAVINVQLSAAEWIEYHCVKDDIKPTELEMAKQYYGDSNIFDQTVYDTLTFVE